MLELPERIKQVLGHGYDITSSYASSAEIKQSVWDIRDDKWILAYTAHNSVVVGGFG